MASLDMVLIRTGATYRQLDHWCRQGYLNAGQPGTGIPRTWSDQEVRVISMMVKLVAAGIPPKVAVQVARAGGNLEIAPGITIIMGSSARPRELVEAGTNNPQEVRKD